MGEMNIQHTSPFTQRSNAQRNGGFTLIELMIAVVVVAIITTIAYPSYTGHVRKARRATAQAALMDVGAKEQAYLLERRAYATTLADLAFATPQEISGAYTITLAVDNAASPMTFVATATPINNQAAGVEQTLTLNQSGARTPAGSAGYWGQ